MLPAFTETIAVVFAVAYVILAIRQNIFCWFAAILSSSLYVLLFYEAGLYMISILQFVYIAMGIYGWRSWRKENHKGMKLRVSSWPLAFHFLPIIFILSMAFIIGMLLQVFSSAVFPFLDSFVACTALIAVWLVAKKVIQNWHYWFIADAVSVYIFVNQGLWPTVSLYILYMALCPVGYRTWSKDLKIS
ncbi:MAG: nicotinamide riboside transporter PnuC [Pseudomonadota bacterium]|nr:nicotinamide riboside transporter PnuC [Pseudomonadota bacterium]